MQSAVGIGRIGPLNTFVHYTWLIVFVLGLWWLALLWLPDTFPRWSGWAYWLVALAVLVLYFAFTLLHEAVHSAVGRIGPRTIVLYPFGAAAPFRMSQLAPGRGVLTALAAPLTNIILGGAMLFLGMVFGTPGSAFALPGAALTALGWLNLALGVVNLIPGIPFDGGWALAAGAYWFSGDRESGQAAARTIGEVAALVIVLLGAWRGLVTNSWLEALALVLLGWMARDAAALSRHRASMRGALDTVTAADIMDSSRATDTVPASATVSDLVRERPRQAPEEPVAVTDGAGALVGFTSLAASESVLQGNWATTPVRAITTPVDQSQVVHANDSVMQVMAMSQGRTGDVELSFPVVEGGRMVGSVNVNRLQGFATAGRHFAMEEAVPAAESRGPLGIIGTLLPAAVIIAAMAVLGSLALRTNPAELREMTAETAEAPLAFSAYSPAENEIIGTGPATISVDISGPVAITTATLELDGEPVESELSGTSPLTQTVRAEVPGLTQGLHSVAVVAGTESGRTKRTTWQFRVSFREGQQPGDEPEPPAPPLRVIEYSPALGQRLVADAADVPIFVVVEAETAPTDATVTLDGQQLDAAIEPSGEGTFSVTASAPVVAAGPHRVRVELFGAEGGFYSTEWTFTALLPDESNVFFPETGQFLSEPFLTYWRDNGALRLFGFPISDRIQETDEVSGAVYTAQYFERARLELHADLGTTVIMGRLGALVYDADPPAAPVAGARFFPETGHNLQGPFLAFWEQYGGLAVFGYPISEEFRETNTVDGKEYTVQYFERNRFEHHPDFAGTPDEVQLGLLGTRLYNEKYGK